MWKTKCFNEAIKNNSSIISLDTLILIHNMQCYGPYRNYCCIQQQVTEILTFTVPASIKRQSFVIYFSRNRVFFILLSTSTFPSAFLKNINKCIPLWHTYLLTSYMYFICSYCFNILKQPERTLSSYVWPGWLYGFLAKSEGFGISIAILRGRCTSLAFWLLHTEAQPWVTIVHSGMGEWCGPFSLSQTVSPNHHLLA